MENMDPINIGFMARPLKIKTCPQCSSVFITEKKCEDCGFVPFKERLGEPFDERSFFSLKENYWAKAPFLMRKFPLFETKSSKATEDYKKLLFLRYTQLIDYFLENSNSHPHYLQYCFEIKTLISELIKYPKTIYSIEYSLLSLSEQKIGPLFNEIEKMMIEKKQIIPKQKLNANIHLVFFIFTTILISILALKAFPYFAR